MFTAIRLVPVLLGLLVLAGAAHGLVVSSDNSDLCNSNMKDCRQRCPAPQNFLFMCSSGGTFSKPQSDCKCITPPPAGVVTDGSATWQMVQWPGAEPCQGNTWLYDCAQYLNMNVMANDISGQATDQASAMAAVAAAKAAAEAQAAQAAQMAAMAAQQQQQPQQQQGQAGSPSSMGGAAMTPGSQGVPGMEPSATGGSGMSPATGMVGMGGNAGMGPSMQGMGMAGPNPGMGGGAGMMGGSSAMPGASLMGANSLGHRHLLQFGAGAPLGGAAPAGGMGGSTGALPTTQLGPACQKALQGVVNGPNSGVLVIPNFKGIASMMTRGNDTMLIQLGGQGSQCVAGYKLMGGKMMDVGRTKEEVQKQQEAAKKSGAGAASPAYALTLLLGCLLATLL